MKHVQILRPFFPACKILKRSIFGQSKQMQTIWNVDPFRPSVAEILVRHLKRRRIIPTQWLNANVAILGDNKLLLCGCLTGSVSQQQQPDAVKSTTSASRVLTHLLMAQSAEPLHLQLPAIICAPG